MKVEVIHYPVNKEKLKDLSHEFDNDVVGLNLNFSTLKSINAERTKVYFQIDNVNDGYSLALTLCNMKRTFAILFDLMNFTVKELVENLEDVDSIKDDYFDLYVKNENTLEPRQGTKVTVLNVVQVCKPAPPLMKSILLYYSRKSHDYTA